MSQIKEIKLVLVDDADSSSAALQTDQVVLDDEKTAREYKLDSADGCILGLCFVDTSVVSPSTVFCALSSSTCLRLALLSAPGSQGLANLEHKNSPPSLDQAKSAYILHTVDCMYVLRAGSGLGTRQHL